MTDLDDQAVAHLRAAVAIPDLGPRYDVSEPIGAGGSSTVFAARDKTLARSVAVKVADAFSPGDAAIHRLEREARILASLEHPGIVPVHDTGVTVDGRAFYVMTLIDGTKLADAAAARPLLADRLGLFLKVCDTIAFAHSHGVVHRDLKPDNVMVGPFGEVLVLDWGVAQTGGNAHSSSADDPDSSMAFAALVVGTPGYMPPEQEAALEVDRRADVFALGSLLAAVMGNHQSRPLDAVVRRASAARPEDRYAYVEELQADVRRFIEGLAVSAYQETAVERVSRLYTRYRVPLALVAAYMAMRVVLLVWGGG